MLFEGVKVAVAVEKLMATDASGRKHDVNAPMHRDTQFAQLSVVLGSLHYQVFATKKHEIQATK